MSALFSERRRGVVRSVKRIYYVASLILHANIAEITAQLLSLSYVYLISSNYGLIIRMFVQINILEGSSHYFIFFSLSDNRNSKIYQWKQFHWEFSCIKIQCVGTERKTNVHVDVQKKSCPVCKNVNRFLSVNCSVQTKRSNGNLMFLLFFHVSNRHEQVFFKTYITFKTCLLFMLHVEVSIILNIHLHKASIFVHDHVD